MSDSGELVKQLKELREEVHLMRGIVISVKRYEETAINAEKRINDILFALTGDEYYNNGRK